MLRIEAPNFEYCPMCGGELALRQDKDIQRKFCPECDWIYYPRVTAAAGAVVLKKDKVLLVKRGIEPFKDKWSLPAGYVSFGEHPEETMAREVKEETGLIVELSKFLDVFQSRQDPREPGHFFFAYRAEIKSGRVKAGDDASDIGWFDLAELPPLAWDIHAKILDRIKKELNAEG